jgi:O-antigen ligase
VALTVRRGPYRAILTVIIDGQPAGGLPRDGAGRAYVVLYDEASRIATVPLAQGLAPGPHTVELVAERGQGQWALVSWHVAVPPVRDGFAWKFAVLTSLTVACLALAVWEAHRVDWHGLRRVVADWPSWTQTALAFGLTGLLWAALALGAIQDLAHITRPGELLTDRLSPWFLVAVPLAGLLGWLFTLRLDLGLALVGFTAPFYLQPPALFYSALSLPELLAVLCMAAAAARRVHGASVRFRLLDLAVCMLVGAAVLATLLAPDVGGSLLALRSVFVLPALSYAVVRLGGLSGGDAWHLVAGWGAGGVAVAVLGLVQYALGHNLVVAEGGLARLRSIYPSPNNVGLYLGRLWPLLVAGALWGTDRKRRVLCGLAALPVTLALVLSFSRGALLLGLPLAWVVMAALAGGRYRWVALAVVLLGALALVPLMRVPRFSSLFELESGSTFFRIELWRSSLQLIEEHPWFGVGPGGFQAAYRTRYILPSAWQEPNLEHPHSIYLDHWARMGVLGVSAGIVAQIAFWRGLWQALAARTAPRGLLIGLAGSMVALLAHGLVDNTVFFPDMALTFFLTLAVLGLVHGQRRERSTQER